MTGLYDTRKWRKIKRHQLRQQPLCELCKAKGLTVAAEVVHHPVPHHGNRTLFYAPEKLMSLCARCHNGITQQQERYGFINDIGADGWPVDHKHPANCKKKDS